MVATKVDTVVRYLRRMAVQAEYRELTDPQLLLRFVAHRDEAAFAALVYRHGKMVWHVCQNVLSHTQDAEDAFQATFMVLAENPSKVRKAEALGSWLHGVALRFALKVRRDAARRRTHEHEAAGMSPPSEASELTWRELRQVLDEEIQRLPEKYRVPFVLCVLQEASLAEAARRLGWKEGTVSGRLSVARKRLRGRLARRGIELSAVVAAVTVAGAAHGGTVPLGLPALLVISTVNAASKFAAGGAATAVSAEVAALIKGGTNAMFTVHSKFVTVLVLVAAGLVGVGARWVVPAAQSEVGRAATELPRAVANTARAAQPTAGKEDDKLEGRWLLTGFEFKGKQVPKDQVKAIKVTWVVTGSKVEENMRGKKREMSFKLDPTKDPKRIDLTVVSGEGGAFFPGGTDKGAIIRGIYRLKGDELAICMNTENDKEPPDNFTTKEDAAWVLYKMKRAAKTKEDQAKDDEIDLPAELDVGDNKMRNLGLALFSYVEDKGRLPAAAIYSKDGKPLLSWRVALLPYLNMDLAKLHGEFRLDEPWDSEHNKKLLAKMPPCYASPSAEPKAPHSTFYQVLVGPNTAFHGMTGRKPEDIKNFSRKVLIVEGAEPVPWTKPQDLPYDAGKPLPRFGGPFRTGFYSLAGYNDRHFHKKASDVDALREEIEIDR